MTERRKVVAVIGDGNITPESGKWALAYEMGKALADAGYIVQTGGLGGVMAAAMQGAKSSGKCQGGDTIAILPSFDRSTANEYADIIVPSGMDIMRNSMVVNADAVIAIGGGAGTLSEMAIAWSLFKLIIAFSNASGWSSELAGRKIDGRIRYEGWDDKIFPVQSPDEAMAVLNENIGKYTRSHHGIKERQDKEQK